MSSRWERKVDPEADPMSRSEYSRGGSVADTQPLARPRRFGPRSRRPGRARRAASTRGRRTGPGPYVSAMGRSAPGRRSTFTWPWIGSKSSILGHFGVPEASHEGPGQRGAAAEVTREVLQGEGTPGGVWRSRSRPSSRAASRSTAMLPSMRVLLAPRSRPGRPITACSWAWGSEVRSGPAAPSPDSCRSARRRPSCP